MTGTWEPSEQAEADFARRAGMGPGARRPRLTPWKRSLSIGVYAAIAVAFIAIGVSTLSDYRHLRYRGVRTTGVVAAVHHGGKSSSYDVRCRLQDGTVVTRRAEDGPGGRMRGEEVTVTDDPREPGLVTHDVGALNDPVPGRAVDDAGSRADRP